ncbi:RpiR family transcriptional regulator [Breznakia blatticola]|uniref:RpiR family transcriptional regulator n=1 Tax=Breznakia blatticola TaxID=1754012 RepID=A0A4V3G619_9FIRM|nr:MurR/RpiR family transcriptional regulator [Breznakia blatticola]TDW08632.1 RpiR family transcriptional regulator [Breznakia blatticola]
MLLIDTLKNQNNFSDTEIVISNYILGNIRQVTEMNIHTLANNTFCSIATISRFCKKLKFTNFSAFKLQLVAEVYNPLMDANRVEYNFPFEKEDHSDEIAKKLVNLSNQTLNDTYQNIDIEKIHAAATLVDNADQIDIFANGNSLVTAIDLHNKMLWMGKNSNLEIVRGFQFIKSQVKVKNKITIIISYYGIDEESIKIARAMHESKTPYILITGPKLNPLCTFASVVIQVTPAEEFNDKLAPISSRIALTYVSDLLYSIVFSLNYEKNKQNVSSHL